MTSNQRNDDTAIPLEVNETPEDCARRLSRRLSEYEAASIDTAGRAKQLRKERDSERSLNQKLRKEMEKLSNQLLRERTKSAMLVKEVEMLRENNKDDEVKNLKDIDHTQSSSIPSDLFTDKNLTLKVEELQKFLEKRIKEEEKKQYKDAGELHSKMAALTMLQQSIQNYLEMRNNYGDCEDGRVETLDAVGTLVNDLEDTHEYLGEKRKNGKVSTWMRILVCLGPIFLSALCYLAFTTVKK